MCFGLSKINFPSVRTVESPPPIYQTSSSTRAEKIKKLFWTALGAWTTYSLFDAGLSQLLGLETLVHGTGPLGYIGISLNGADPNFGGGDTGSSASIGADWHLKHSKKYFHVFKDTAIFSDDICESTSDCLYQYYATSLLPRIHAVGSGMSNFGFSTSKGIGRLARGVVGSLAGLFTPTLKFRFKPEEILDCVQDCRFTNDPDYESMAYRTAFRISPTRLGVVGSLSQGINADTFSRMASRPAKVLFGVAMIGLAVLIARATYRYARSKTNPVLSSPDKTVTPFRQRIKRIGQIGKQALFGSAAIAWILFNTL